MADDLGARASRPLFKPHKGWTSRGYLPHFDHPSFVQSITFRLADSLPGETYRKLKTETDTAALRDAVEDAMDECRGACALANPAIAASLRSSLLHFDSERYRLLAWVIMPNHVHVLIEQIEGSRLADVVQAWKSFSTKEANRILGCKGKFWAPEYFDRYIRDAGHLEAARNYIHENPVRAGLATRAEDWAWSSAREERGRPARS